MFKLLRMFVSLSLFVAQNINGETAPIRRRAVTPTVGTEERILLPIFGEAPIDGLWLFRSILSVHNRTATAITLDGVKRTCVLPCPPDPGRIIVGANQTLSGDFELAARPSVIPSRLVYVRETTSARSLDINLRLSIGSTGTELPVIREGQFREGVVNLLPVPSNDLVTNTVRLYSFVPVTFVVRVYRVTELHDDLIGERVVVTTGGDQYTPMYAQITDLPKPPGGSVLRVEINPTDPNARYWAFDSVLIGTSVFVVSPQ